jgi:hypothetical protein
MRFVNNDQVVSRFQLSAFTRRPRRLGVERFRANINRRGAESAEVTQRRPVNQDNINGTKPIRSADRIMRECRKRAFE